MKHLKIKEEYKHWACVPIMVMAMIFSGMFGIALGLIRSSSKCDAVIKESLINYRFTK